MPLNPLKAKAFQGVQLIDKARCGVKSSSHSLLVMKLSQSFKSGAVALTGLLVTGVVSSYGAVDFVRQVKPVLESTCLSCHGPEKPKGDLQLHTKEGAFKGGENGAAIVAKDPSKSPLYTTTVLPADHDDIMPPKGDVLSKQQSEVIKQWIAEGAVWPDGLVLKQSPQINFAKDVQPILEFNCVACHREGHDKGGLRLDTKELAFTTGDSGPSIVPFFAEKSKSFTLTTLSKDDDDLMPPASKGGPLPKDKQDILKEWINQGANWPDGITLTPKKAEQGVGGDNFELVVEMHKRIVTAQKEKTAADMKAYNEVIPGGSVNFDMIPIPGGTYTMGTPASEKNRKDDEGPQIQVKIDPFWMGKTEVTWNEYELFMYPEDQRLASAAGKTAKDPVVDGVSRPTKPYVEMSFGMGKDGFPAISMTHHAANKYCQWLSAKTGHYYRLPTEAEWEYACRAGTTTAYSFGDDASKIGEYAWYEANSDWKYQKVGKKKPNPWGLHDMHGNVIEWCLDQYSPDTYKAGVGKVLDNPWIKSSTPYPHVARGGSWDDTPEKLRSGVRRASGPAWKIQDPQLPKSIWYHTDAQFLGLRVVRPLKVPTPEELNKIWNNGVEKD